MKKQGRISETAFRAFLRTSGMVRNKMEPYFARFGISGAQWGIMRALARAEGEGVAGLRLGDLGKRLLVRAPSVTTLVDRLEREGLVGRRTEEGDQRAKLVTLSGAGRALVARVLVGHSEFIAGVMAGLSEEEQGVLEGLMVRMARHLEGGAREMEKAGGKMDKKENAGQGVGRGVEAGVTRRVKVKRN